METLTEKKEELQLISRLESSWNPSDLSGRDISREMQSLMEGLSLDLKQAEQANERAWYFYLASEVAENLKHYFLFIRNSYIEKIKAKSKEVSGHTDAEKVEKFTSNLINDIEKARSVVLENIRKSNNQRKNPEFIEEIMRKEQLIESPIAVYFSQYNVIKDQIAEINVTEKFIKKIERKFSYIRNSLINKLDEKAKFIERSREYFNLTIQLNEAGPLQFEDIKNIDTKLQKEIKSLYKEEDWKTQLFSFLEQLEAVQLITDYDYGNVITRTIPFSTLLQRWIRINILPNYKKLIEDLKDLFSVQSKSQKNILGILSHQSESEEEFREFDMDVFLEAKKELMNQHWQNINSRIEQLKNEVNEVLKVDNLFGSKNWLDYNVQRAYSQVRFGLEDVVNSIVTWWNGLGKNIRKTLRLDWESDRDNPNESIISFVKDRTVSSQHNFYRAIFLDYEGIGDYFYSERIRASEKLDKIIRAWEKGFGSSLMIKGNSGSGKTSFLREVYSAVKDYETYQIFPNRSVIVEGRKFTTNYNLAESLSEFSKSISSTQKYCLIVEDIELWRDEKNTIAKNLEALIEFIDRSGRNILIICSTNNLFYTRSQTLARISELFHATIDVSLFNTKAFLQSLKLRHEATQNILENELGSGMTTYRLRKLGKLILKANHYNVKAALHHWVALISQEGNLNAGNLKQKAPQIVTENNKALLHFLTIYKKTSEQEIIKSFPADELSAIRNQIGRLLKQKILVRNEDGTLMLAPIIGNEVSYQLDWFDPKEELIDYVLQTSEIQIEKKKVIQEAVHKALIEFPFLSENSRVHLELNHDHFELDVRSVEFPADILKYLNKRLHPLEFTFKMRK